ncbi:MAG: hypothetical protein PHC28_04825 [Flavobacterium sp.]|uniref:hypothetical protein n=1 Tax=Flavobacterium sp. TaxID=239 RepID=UPI002630BD36|nr:hypothetical protein [Flavobacterium sp.]MDD5149789.1 hypothetical protein [Flavobacterium sp.]
MGKTLIELIEELKVTTNPVTYWSIKVAIIDRLDRKELYLNERDLLDSNRRK